PIVEPLEPRSRADARQHGRLEDGETFERMRPAYGREQVARLDGARRVHVQDRETGRQAVHEVLLAIAEQPVVEIRETCDAGSGHAPLRHRCTGSGSSAWRRDSISSAIAPNGTSSTANPASRSRAA